MIGRSFLVRAVVLTSSILIAGAIVYARSAKPQADSPDALGGTKAPFNAISANEAHIPATPQGRTMMYSSKSGGIVSPSDVKGGGKIVTPAPPTTTTTAPSTSTAPVQKNSKAATK